jgi:hypothetical protein
MVLLFFNLDYEYIIQKDLKEVIKKICHRMFITVFCVTTMIFIWEINKEKENKQINKIESGRK